MAARQRERGGAMASLDLALIGNGTIGAFVDPAAEITWTCFPRFDGDPMFCSLLKPGDDIGFFAIELLDRARVEQKYLHNTPVVVTRVTDSAGGAIEITDFAPRFNYRGRVFSPMMIVRRIQRLAGHPRIRVRLRPAQSYGQPLAATTSGSNHIRYVGNPLWLRDAYFVVNALNRLGATQTMERYLNFILNIVADGADRPLDPVYTITGHRLPPERVVASLPGYRGIGPVRVGNQASEQAQHDVYGSSILAATHVFYDRRLVHQGDESLFRRLEPLGERCVKLFDQPDAGLWELRGSTHVHTFSAVMCWVGCERLGRIAKQLGLADRAAYWCDRARELHEVISQRAWNAKLGTFVATFGGDTLDASLLQLNELFFVADDDPRFVATVRAIGKELKRGKFVFR